MEGLKTKLANKLLRIFETILMIIVLASIGTGMTSTDDYNNAEGLMTELLTGVGIASTATFSQDAATVEMTFGQGITTEKFVLVCTCLVGAYGGFKSVMPEFPDMQANIRDRDGKLCGFMIITKEIAGMPGDEGITELVKQMTNTGGSSMIMG
jgi:hypothetical protein